MKNGFLWRNYKSPNLGLLFYKRIYSEHKTLLKIKEEGNRRILFYNVSEKESEFNPFYDFLYSQNLGAFQTPISNLGNCRFTLFTTYPGLLVGSGYAHETKSLGDASIGLFFDHTTGLPVIPGSSVKGVLRSFFEMSSPEEALNFIIGEYKEATNDKEMFKDIEEKEGEIASKLVSEIFGDKDGEGTDVFFDAIIELGYNNKDEFLGPDYITPHPDPLKNPTPIQFLKVLPNIGFKFRFDLKDGGIISSKQKEALFKHILLTIGVGAKTNVGYGQFTEDRPSTTQKTDDNHKCQERVDNSKRNKRSRPIKETINDLMTDPSEETLKNIKINTESTGKIILKKNDNFLIEMPQFDGTYYNLKKKEDRFKDGIPEIGKRVRIVFLQDNKVESFHAFIIEE